MKSKHSVILIAAALAGFLTSCSKEDSEPTVICHITEYKDGVYLQEYTETNITCKECQAQNKSYTEPDTEFPNLTYHITDKASCQ